MMYIILYFLRPIPLIPHNKWSSISRLTKESNLNNIIHSQLSMGKHFDNLVELVNKEMPKSIVGPMQNPKGYLTTLLERVALFDFPLNAEEIFPRSGKDAEEYSRYLNDYHDLSEQHEQFLIMPFAVTGIEDKTSVVIFDPLGYARYKVTVCLAEYTPSSLDISMLVIADVKIRKWTAENQLPVAATPLYTLTCTEGIRSENEFIHDDEHYYSCQLDMTQAVISFIEQCIYIMDPDNFIIRKENNASMQIAKKNLGKKNPKPRKTVMRPHYVCLSEDETSAFLKDVSKEPRPAHPVRGYWKRLISERFVHKRGQRIYIQQYFTGEGKVEGKNGWQYQVMIKEDPVTIVSYLDEKNSK